MPTAKRIIKSMTPPFLWAIGKDLKRRLFRTVDHYEYSPSGWATPFSAHNEDYWTTFIDRERTACERLIARVSAGAPIVADDPYDTARHAAYGFALVRASLDKRQLSVLDYGGSLGHYYWLGKSLAPDVVLDYHCKELPRVVATGRSINPAVNWHTDDACLARTYDLVMFSGSLQYVRPWRETLGLAARATRGYLLLSDIPAVRTAPTFAATQRSNGVTNVHHQFNRTEVLTAVEEAGLKLVAEFSLGPYPPVLDAPEQPTVFSWLFQRAASI